MRYGRNIRWNRVACQAGALLLTMALAAALSRVADAASLRSPWDEAPPHAMDVPAVTFPRPPVLPKGISAADYYVDKAHSVIDPQRKQAYDEAVSGLHAAATASIAFADRYREVGDLAAAQCAADWLDSFADAGALTGTLSTNQAVYVQGWMLGAFAAIALKIRPFLEMKNEAGGRIADWLAGVAEQQIAYYTRRVNKIDARNNHRYWAGFAVIEAAIAADRRDLFDWAVGSFRLGAAQITHDGTLPLELERRARALHYHLFAAAPLVMIAELSLANGLDLYRENDHALGRLVHRALAGMKDPVFFAEKAGIAQEPVAVAPDSVAWAVPYWERFHDPEIVWVAQEARSGSFIYTGGRPPPISPPLSRAN
jgi:poly(beta-D-mannuronate) lyase